MAKAPTPDRELDKITKAKSKLLLDMEQLEQREKAAREALARASNDALVEAFSKGQFGKVSKSQASQLARQISTHGIEVILERLSK